MSRIHLTRLEIRELFGRQFDLKLERLGAGVTVVYGPNASGKSSLTSAASRIFHTSLMQPADHVLASLDLGGAGLTVALRGPKSANECPQSARPSLYSLSIPDLIAGPSGEDTQLIRDALAGGIDLNKCLPTKNKSKPDLDGPRGVLEARRNEAQSIAVQERSLDELEMRRDKASEASKDLHVIENWIAAAEAESEAEALETQIREIRIQHPGIELQQPNAADDLREALKSLRDAEGELELARNALSPFHSRKAEKPLAANDAAEIRRLSSETAARNGALSQTEQSIRHLRGQIEQAELKLPPVGRAPLPFDPSDRQMLAGWVRTIIDAKSELDKAVTAERENKDSFDLDLQSLQAAGGELETVDRVRRDEDSVRRALDFDSSVQRARDACENAAFALSQSHQKLDAAREALPRIDVGIDPSKIMAILRAEPSISDLADEVRRLTAERTAKERIAHGLKEKADERKQNSLGADMATRALVDWLRAIPPAESGKKPVAIVIAALLIAVLMLLLGIAKAPVPAIALGALGLVGIAILLWMAKAPSQAGSRQSEIQSSVHDAWKPAHWTISEVASKLEEAVARTKETEACCDLLLEAQALAKDVSSSEQQAELDRRMAQLREGTGFDFTYPYQMGLLVRQLSSLQDAIDDCKSKSNYADKSQATLEAATAERANFLRECGVQVQSGEAFRTLAAGCGRMVTARTKLQQAEEHFAATEGALAQADQSLREFFERYGWPYAGDCDTARQQFIGWIDVSEAIANLEKQLEGHLLERQRLEEAALTCSGRLVEHLQAYGHPIPANPIDGVETFFEWFDKSARVELAEKAVENRLDSLLDRLRRNGVPDEGDVEYQCQVPSIRSSARASYFQLSSDAEGMRRDANARRHEFDEAVFERHGLARAPTYDQLTDLQNRLSKTATELDGLIQKISSIRAAIDHATKETGLVVAQKNMDQAISLSSDWLATMAKVAANKAVLASIEKLTREENTTPVIESANRWLERLTHRRYGSLKEDGKNVTVEDRDSNNRVQTTEQLSTGTKVHLALAVRLAVIEQSETHQLRFPLFLDEVMATSDPNARRAIAEALKEISMERQVIVLTNQPDDVHLLEESLGTDLTVVVLPKAEPVPVAPPAIAPRAVMTTLDYGLPLHSSVRRWRTSLIKDVLESPVGPEGSSVDDVLRASGNRNDGVIVAVIDSLRKEVAKSYGDVEWKDIAEIVGSSDKRDEVRLAWEENHTNPKRFLEVVSEIKRIHKKMVDRVTDRLIELRLLDEINPPAEGKLRDIALTELPESLHDRADDLVRLFQDYL